MGLHPNALEAKILCLGIGYLFGGLLTAEAVARAVSGKSVRQLGSGNPGMANVMQTLGVRAGLLVLAGDLLKTAAACGIGFCAAGHAIGRLALWYAGLGAVLGHDYPLWSRFRGGKGVAVTCGWLMLCMPLSGTLCCLAGGAAVLWRGYLPLGAVLVPALAVWPAWRAAGAEGGLVVLAAALLMLLRHRNGLRRILRGTEPKYFRHGNA